MKTRFGRLPARRAVLVTNINGPYAMPLGGTYRYTYWATIYDEAEGSKYRRMVIALKELAIPFTEGSLIVVRRWHKDHDGEWVWRLDN